MEGKKEQFISLKKAAEVSGYSPDYLGYLIRTKKIKGKKIYNNISWQTTLEEIIKYSKKIKKNLNIQTPYFSKKKYISLKKAAKLSGYSSDYLGDLIRKEKIKGKKIYSGICWLTSEEAIKKHQEKKTRVQGQKEITFNFSPYLNLIIPQRGNRIFGFSWRLAVATFVILFLITGSTPVKFLQSSIGTIFAEEEKVINFYSAVSTGDWQNTENVQSLPEVESLGTIDSFSKSNSAVYEGGALVLIAENFQPNSDTNLDEKQIESAKIKISFAIKEKEPDILIQQQETSDQQQETGNGEIGLWNKIKNFFRASVIRTVNLVKASLIKIVSIVRAEDSIPPIDTNIELMNTNGEETGGEGQETSETEETEETEEIEEIEEEPEEEEFEEGEQEEEETEETEETEEAGQEASDQQQETSDEEEEGATTTTTTEVTSTEATTTETITTDTTTTTEIIEPDAEDAGAEQATTTYEQATTTEQETGDQQQETSDEGQEESTTTDEGISDIPPEDTLPNIDAKIIIWYSLNDQDWQELDTISDYPLSNALNDGYFEYDASFLKSWDDIKNLKIKFEGVIGGETNIIVYLDSVWIETNCQQQATSDKGQETGEGETDGEEISDQGEEVSMEEATTTETTTTEATMTEATTSDEEIIEETPEEEAEEEAEEKPIEEEVEEVEEPEELVEEPEPEEEEESEEEELEEEHQGEIESLSKKNSFRANENPEFRFRYKKVYYKFLALNKKPDTTFNLTTTTPDITTATTTATTSATVTTSTSITTATSSEDLSLFENNSSSTSSTVESNNSTATSATSTGATTSSSTTTLSNDSFINSNSTSTISFENQILGTLISEPVNNSNTNTSTPPVKNLWEDIKVNLEIKGPDSNRKDFDYNISFEDNGDFSIELEKPSQFQPGRYKLIFTIEENDQTQEFEQTFTWGILAINTNKSIYVSGTSVSGTSSNIGDTSWVGSETAYIQMAALRDDGHTICDANLKLEIILPQGNITYPEVQKSGKCGPDNVTDVPDYFAYYQISKIGIHQMRLTNLDNGYEIEDSFEVRDYVPFDVERIGPTRIYPPAIYGMTLKIKANENFSGQVIESVPESFEVIEANQSRISTRNDAKEIVWDVSWKTSEEYELSYQFDAPNISPYLYLLGPLEIGSFQEIRQWQVAADSPDTITIEQQINIIDQEYSISASVFLPVDSRLGLIKWDGTKYSDETVYFEAVIKTDNPERDIFAALFEDGETNPVTATGTVSHTGDTNWTRERSVNPISLSDGTSYTVRIAGPDTDANFSIKAARLIIVQTDETSITSTQTQIEVGYNAITTDTSYTSTTDPKIYYYDSSKFDPAPTAYFEATIKNDNITGDATNTSPTNCGLAENVDTGGNDWNVASNGACDATNDTYSTVTTAGTTPTDYLKITNFNFNIAPGSTITGIVATIEANSTKVGGKLADDYNVYIVKGSTIRTDSTDMAYVDDWPTSDAVNTYPNGGATNNTWGVAEGWTSLDINNSGFGLAFEVYEADSKACVVSVDNITLKVYYTTPGGVATTSVRLWNKTDGQAVTGSEIATTTTSWSRIRSSAIASANFPTEKEYLVQIQTSNADITARIANAKIILDQATGTGIDKVEMVHQYVNTTIVTASSSYTGTDFDNQYNPDNWSVGSFNHYFEATLKNSPDTTYAQLYVTGYGPIINSEVSTTSGSYVRERSADLSKNGNWPSSTSTLDTQIKGSPCYSSYSPSPSWSKVADTLVRDIDNLGDSAATVDKDIYCDDYNCILWKNNAAPPTTVCIDSDPNVYGNILWDKTDASSGTNWADIDHYSISISGDEIGGTHAPGTIIGVNNWNIGNKNWLARDHGEGSSAYPAMQACINKGAGWRLPNGLELDSIRDQAKGSVPYSRLPNIQTDFY